jgi:hypothetical protein
MREPRRRLGGVGLAMFDRYPSTVPYFERGIPKFWSSIDDNNLPSYESESDYLRRHGLFLPGEEARLTLADFAPEIIRE